MNPSKRLPWPTVVGGRYQLPPALRLFAREGDDDQTTGDEALSAGQVTAINSIVHKAIGSRLSSQSFKESIGEIAGTAATAAISEAAGGIAEQVAATIAESNPKPKGGDDEGKSFKDEPEYKAMVQRDKDREIAHKKIEADRQAEVDGRLRSEEKTALEKALRTGGVEELKIRSCVATLLHEDNVMQRDNNGQIIYRIDKGEYNEDMGVEAGVKLFLESDEGKTFLPASGSRGTGVKGDSTNTGNNSTQKGAKMSKGEAAQVVTDFIGAAG